MHYPDLLVQPTRFAAIPARAAAIIMALLLALFLWGSAASSSPVALPTTGAAPVQGALFVDKNANGQGDIHLYRSIIAAMRAGQGYYAGTAHLLRAQDYPLRPFIAFRLPTLAALLASIPDLAGQMLIALLCGGVIFAWTMRIAPALKTQESVGHASLLLLLGCLTVSTPTLAILHESWAALLIALSLALHRPAHAPGRWWPSVLIALFAVMIRELALPFLLLMTALSLYRRQWAESAAWTGAIALFGAALVFHMQQVGLVTTAADPASPGWSAMGGWPHLIASIHASTILTYLPATFTAALVPLALLGWAAWRDATGLATFLFLSGMSVLMMLFGRPDNFYWAAIVGPLFMVGLLFAPGALRDLARSARPPTALALR